MANDIHYIDIFGFYFQTKCFDIFQVVDILSLDDMDGQFLPQLGSTNEPRSPE